MEKCKEKESCNSLQDQYMMANSSKDTKMVMENRSTDKKSTMKVNGNKDINMVLVTYTLMMAVFAKAIFIKIVLMDMLSIIGLDKNITKEIGS